MTTKNIHKFEFKMGRTGLILFVLGMSGMLFGVFLLGITIGKNIDSYPEKIARFLPDKIKNRFGLPLETAKPVIVAGDDRKKQNETTEEGNPDEESDLTFYDTLGKRKAGQKVIVPEGMIPKKEAVAGVKEQGDTQLQVPLPQLQARTVAPPAVAGTPTVAPGIQQKTPAPAGHAAPAVPAKVQPKAPVVDVPPVSKMPQVKEPAKEKEKRAAKFLIQVVSYKEKAKAEALAKKISKQGYTAQTEVMELPGKGKWFRVIVGGFAERQDAEKTVVALSKNNAGLNCVVRPAATGNGQ